MLYPAELWNLEVTFKLKKAAIAAFLSGWQDSNLRPPAPKAGAMTGLRYTPKVYSAERAGFEPAVPLPVRQFSKLVVSATHPSLCLSEKVCKYRSFLFYSQIKDKKKTVFLVLFFLFFSKLLINNSLLHKKKNIKIV